MITDWKVKIAETCYLMVLEFISPQIKCEKKTMYYTKCQNTLVSPRETPTEPGKR